MTYKINPFTGLLESVSFISVTNYSDSGLIEVREIISLSDEDMENKYFDLLHIPYNGEIELTPIGGGEQEIDIDFEIKDDDDGYAKRLSWDGKGLDGLLEINDKIQLEYKYK